jgi:hypothetical protein
MVYRRKYKKLPSLTTRRISLKGTESTQEILEELSADYLAVVANITFGALDDESLSKSSARPQFEEIFRAELLSFKKPELGTDFNLHDIPDFKYGFEERNDATRVMTLVHKDGKIQPIVRVSTYEPVQNSRVIEDAKRIVESTGGNSRLTQAGVSVDGTKFEVSLAFGSFEIESKGKKSQIRQIAKLWSSHNARYSYHFAFSLLDAETSSILYWNVEKIIHKAPLEKHLKEIRDKLEKHNQELKNFIQEIQVLAAIPVAKESPVFLDVLNLAVPHEKRFEKASYDMRAWLQGKIIEKFTNYALEENENAWVLYKACNEFILDRKAASNEVEDADISALREGDIKKQLAIKERLFLITAEMN